MITLIEALNYKSLRYIRRPLSNFHILVGPNASGKTTFLDVIAFMSELVSNGLESALDKRSRNFQDLVWKGRGNRFEIAIEAKIPLAIADRLSKKGKAFDIIRYELAIGTEKDSDTVEILEERVLLKVSKLVEHVQRELFPSMPEMASTLMSTKGTKNTITIVNKVRDGNDYFKTELYKGQSKSKGWQYAFKLGSQKSSLGNIPTDEEQFPATTWLKNLLTEGVQTFILNSLLIRRASPPGQKRGFNPDGSNLPWVIEDLSKQNSPRFGEWISHIRTALPDIENIRTIEREDDRHRYLLIKYKNGLEVPSWTVSDGTLRLLALTLPAYIPDLKGIYLIEEPENGIHPKAVETVFQSLSSVYDAQILMASHSPVILGISKPEDILCFAKTKDGSTDIVSGDHHPALAKWQGETNLGVLFAAGVLG
ncbi:MAG: ATP-binding protein [Methylococcales bacterium]|nr:ATP-binding protein [Methylococcales bacterium]